MIAKILLTLDIDEEEYRMPSDGRIEEELQEAVHEFVYDIDGMEIKSMRVTTE
jgi:hypothetical protein|tara:strand:+ start:509 stop:667 length:159 start_codon:yes stop_codon:yes gene_type:complete